MGVRLLKKIIGRDDVRRGQPHDRKGHRAHPATILPALATRVTQTLFDWPYVPWAPFAAVQRFEHHLTPRSSVLEFGSGRSTMWFAQHAARVVSLETEAAWHARIQTALLRHGLLDVDYRLANGADYCAPANLAGARFDLIAIDGWRRDLCAETAVKLVAPGGLIYLDKSDSGSPERANDIRTAERTLASAAAAWGSEPDHLTGYALARGNPAAPAQHGLRRRVQAGPTSGSRPSSRRGWRGARRHGGFRPPA